MNEEIKKFRLKLFLKYYKSFKFNDMRTLFFIYKKDQNLFLKKLEKLNNIKLTEFYDLELNYFIASKEILNKKYNEYKIALLITTILFNFSGLYFEEKMIERLKIKHLNYKMKRNKIIDNDGIDVIFSNNYKQYFYQFKYKNIKKEDIDKFRFAVKNYKSSNKEIFAFLITKEQKIKINV